MIARRSAPLLGARKAKETKADGEPRAGLANVAYFMEDYNTAAREWAAADFGPHPGSPGYPSAASPTSAR